MQGANPYRAQRFTGYYMINNKQAFIKDMAAVINKHSRENVSNTPDFLLAEYLYECLSGAENLIICREKYYGHFSTPTKP